MIWNINIWKKTNTCLNHNCASKNSSRAGDSVQYIPVVFIEVEGDDKPNPHSAICPSPAKKNRS